jgi:hypothetical protein
MATSPIVCSARSQLLDVGRTLLAFAALAASAGAQSWVTYDALLGTPPTAQCFQTGIAGAPPLAAVSNGRLHVGPTAGGDMLYWSRNDFALDFNAGFTMELTAEVVWSDCGVAAASNWPRFGVDMAATDDAGRFVLAMVCDGTLYLGNHPYQGVDGVNVRTKAFAATGAAHVFRVESSATGSILLVDGSPELTIPPGPILFPNSREVYFGDGTTWANSESYISSFRASGNAPCCGPSIYCTAKTNSLGCTPAIGFSGSPSATSGSPFVVRASNVLSHKSGLCFYGFAANNAPFQGGTMCAQSPLRRTLLQDSGGNQTPDCSGLYSLDFNARIQSGVDPQLVPGANVYAQFWSRDPATQSTTGLTDALAFTICN